MFRWVVIVVVAGPMLADPIVCRAESAGLPCAMGCHSLQDPASAHPDPARSGPDSAHGCICQGATQGVDGKSLHDATSDRSLPIAAFLASIVLSSPHPEQADADAPPIRPNGRAVRIERQSFQF